MINNENSILKWKSHNFQIFYLVFFIDEIKSIVKYYGQEIIEIN